MTKTSADALALRPFCVPGSGQCRVIGMVQFAEQEPGYFDEPAGRSLRDIVGPTAACKAYIDGVEIPEDQWEDRFTADGETIRFIAGPRGGNAGKAIRTIAIAVISYYAPGWGTYLAGGAGATASLISAGIIIGGTMALNALIPPVSPSVGQAQDPYSQSYSLTGTSNQAAPEGYIPCVLGQVRFYPPHAALPYTELSGEDQYLRMLLDLGKGDDLEVSDLQIGDTPFSSYDDIEYEITRTPTLFTQDVAEQQLASVLNATGDADQRTAAADSTELSVDLLFPQGLYAIDNKGRTRAAWVYVDVIYRPLGTSTWLSTKGASPSVSSSAMQSSTGSTYKVTGSANEGLRVGLRWKVPAGQYEVKVARTGDGYDSSVQHVNDMTWTALRAYSASNPSTTGTLKLAIRIKATGQLNGMVNQVNVLAVQKVRTYSTTTGKFGTPIATKNPAWILMWLVTQCPAVARLLEESRVALDRIARWAIDCDNRSLTYCAVLDSARAFGDLIRDVLAAGLATFGRFNGLIAPIRDIAQTVPMQLFTPKNSWGFTFERNFAQPPHALRCRFTNPEASYQEDVRIVYWDGYNPGNATRFEELDLRYMDDAVGVWHVGRYHLAVAWLRPGTYTLSADIEQLPLERGDLVEVASDVVGWGLSYGRVVQLSADRLTVTLDEEVELDPAKSYRFRVRCSDNSRSASDLSTINGSVTADGTWLTADVTSWYADTQGGVPYRALRLSTPLNNVRVGDLWVLGEVEHDVAELLITAINPTDDLKATLTLVDNDPAVYAADAGPVPGWASQITGTPWCAPPAVPKLDVWIGQSTPDDAGVVHNQVGGIPSGGQGIYRLPTYKQQQLGVL
ncbi:MAG: host specificity factor TipJ family phage tail protein [Sphingobium limneticum]